MTKPRFITPSFLIIMGLVLLLAATFLCQLEQARHLGNQVKALGIELAQANSNSSQATANLTQEREKIIAAGELRKFASLDELKLFLARDNTNEHEYIKHVFDCEDFAFMLQRQALESGYLINCQKLPVVGIEHMCNMAIVGNEIYYIEPKTDQVTYAGVLDP